MILACHDIYKAFGTDELIKNGSFHINEGEKAAIVGINGAGKTTLLKIITGEEPADSGEVTLAHDKKLGYLAQYQDESKDTSIYEEVLSAKSDLIDMESELRNLEEGLATVPQNELESYMSRYHKLLDEFNDKGGNYFRSEAQGILMGLGFSKEELNRSMRELSGGQKTRVNLAKLLVEKPDVLLLDEPTNHLDINSVIWLEGFLKGYSGAVLIVSHDRYFLDHIVTKVIEIFNKKVNVYEGNYTAYSQKKSQARAAELKAYENQQRELAHQKQVIDKLKSFNREKSIKRAESREKALSKIELLEKPVEEKTEMHLVLDPELLSGKDVLSVVDLKKSFPGKDLFSNISFEIKRGERVALLGDNGTGKTTLLKIITDSIDADAGVVNIGTNVCIGYYDQAQQQLTDSNTLFDEIREAYPDMNNTRVRNVLASFLFTGEDVFKKIGDLSGGERGRVAIAKLMLSRANFLILDEPTNHLDMISKEILEDVLNTYTGTVLFVSHDRYFVNKTATRILDLTHNMIVDYNGNYDYYLEKRDELTNIKLSERERNSGATAAPVGATLNEEPVKKLSGKEQHEENKRLNAERKKQANALKKMEEEIEKLENEKNSLEEQMALPENAVNSAKLNELHSKISEIEEKLSELYDKWEELAE